MHETTLVEFDHSVHGKVQLLSISRIDGEKMQYHEINAVKEEALGDVYAFQVFPKKMDMVDNYNMYHLWVTEVPIGLDFNMLEHVRAYEVY